MNGRIIIDYEKKQIKYTKDFAACITDPTSDEYALLQRTRLDYPDFTVIRRTIKTNPTKKAYKGLTYDYMRNYINNHEPKATAAIVLAEFDEMKTIGDCHKNAFTYATIKKWFLNRYPAIAEFGLENNSKETAETTLENIIDESSFDNNDEDEFEDIENNEVVPAA